MGRRDEAWFRVEGFTLAREVHYSRLQLSPTRVHHNDVNIVPVVEL